MEDNKDTSPAPLVVKYDSLDASDGTRYKTLLTRKYKERKPYSPPNPAIIKSFIPGTIREIFIKEGQLVAQGETLLILEAMKMLNNLAAPIDGEIKKIHVAVGDVVANKQVLVELKPVKLERKPAKKTLAKAKPKTKVKVAAKEKDKATTAKKPSARKK